MTIATRNVVKKELVQCWLFWFVISLAFCLVGVSYAGWHEQLPFTGSVRTGSIDMAFTEASVIKQENGKARITYQDDHLHMVIEEPKKELYVRFEYVVSNLGTLPVAYETEFVNVPSTLLVHQRPSSGVLNGGESAEGFIEIIPLYEDGFFEEGDAFMVLLEYQQWNENSD